MVRGPDLKFRHRMVIRHMRSMCQEIKTNQFEFELSENGMDHSGCNHAATFHTMISACAFQIGALLRAMDFSNEDTQACWGHLQSEMARSFSTGNANPRSVYHLLDNRP